MTIISHTQQHYERGTDPQTQRPRRPRPLPEQRSGLERTAAPIRSGANRRASLQQRQPTTMSKQTAAAAPEPIAYSTAGRGASTALILHRRAASSSPPPSTIEVDPDDADYQEEGMLIEEPEEVMAQEQEEEQDVLWAQRGQAARYRQRSQRPASGVTRERHTAPVPSAPQRSGRRQVSYITQEQYQRTPAAQEAVEDAWGSTALLPQTRPPASRRPPVVSRRRLLVGGLACTGTLLAVPLAGAGLAKLNAWKDSLLDDWQYGNPRTFQMDAVVGHNHDSPSHPTHLIAENLHGQILVVEFPGGDPAKAVLYQGPTITDPAVPVTLSLRQRPDAPGRPDLLVHVHIGDPSFSFVLVNDGARFKAPIRTTSAPGS